MGSTKGSVAAMVSALKRSNADLTWVQLSSALRFWATYPIPIGPRRESDTQLSAGLKDAIDLGVSIQRKHLV
jgi:hypothetical protein